MTDPSLVTVGEVLPEGGRWALGIIVSLGVAGASIIGTAFALDGRVDAKIDAKFAAHKEFEALTTGADLIEIKGMVKELHDVCVKRGDCPVTRNGSR